MPIDPNRDSWKPGEPWEKALDEMNYIRSLAREMGGPDRIKRQHDGDRYTIRERIEKFLDSGSFFEAGPMVGAAEYDADGNMTEFLPGAYVLGMILRFRAAVHTMCTRELPSLLNVWPCSMESLTFNSSKGLATLPSQMRPPDIWGYQAGTSGTDNWNF